MTTIDPLVNSTHQPYEYAADDPIPNSDPSGLSFWGGALSFGEGNPCSSDHVRVEPYQEAAMSGHPKPVLFALSSLVVLALSMCLPANAMQVGAVPHSDSVRIAVRTDMSEPSALIQGKYGRYYWVGVNFPAGWFMQTGYMDAGDNSGASKGACPGKFSTFTTILLDNEFVGGYYGVYNPTDCGVTGSHYFKIAIAYENSEQVNWQAYIGLTPIGPSLELPARDDTFPKNKAAVISEITNSTNSLPKLGSGSAFPTVTYNPMMEFKASGSDDWVAATDAKASVTGPDYDCNWFTEYVILANAVETGKPSNLPTTPCYAYGDSLW